MQVRLEGAPKNCCRDVGLDLDALHRDAAPTIGYGRLAGRPKVSNPAVLAVGRLGQTCVFDAFMPDQGPAHRVSPTTRTEIPTTGRSALQGAGFEIIDERQPSFLFDKCVLVTGEVDRTTGYEPGLVIFTGCRHAGIVNISRYVLALTGGSQVYGLLGGFSRAQRALARTFGPAYVPDCVGTRFTL